ncbi:MAG: hypothetical protein AB1499_16240, partial [Nitrospirota bacterium]
YTGALSTDYIKLPAMQNYQENVTFNSNKNIDLSVTCGSSSSLTGNVIISDGVIAIIEGVLTIQ